MNGKREKTNAHLAAVILGSVDACEESLKARETDE